MNKRPALLHFHGTLADLLSRDDHGPDARGTVSYPVTRRASIKDVIEALGPPHTEVGSIEADGREVGFEHLLEPGEKMDIRPLATPFEVLRPSLLRPEPMARIAFAVDANAGRLATLLRTLGFDTAYDQTMDDAPLAELAVRESRILLTKDRNLLKRSLIMFGSLIRTDDPHEQLRAVLRLLDLRPPYHLFSRCLLCNAPLEPVPKAEIMHRLLPLTRRHYFDFHRCPRCDKIYWPGSHHDHMRERIENMSRDLFMGSAGLKTDLRPQKEKLDPEDVMAKKSLPLSKVYSLLEPGPVVLLTTALDGRTNIMTMSWLTMMEFEPPLVGCVVSNANHSFGLLQSSRECVINIPTVELADKVVACGNSSGSKVNKFETFQLTPRAATQVGAPLIDECYVSLECRVVDTDMVEKYSFFVLEVIKAWIDPAVRNPQTIHHQGKGAFMVAGEKIKLKSKMK